MTAAAAIQRRRALCVSALTAAGIIAEIQKNLIHGKCAIKTDTDQQAFEFSDMLQFLGYTTWYNAAKSQLNIYWA